MKGYNAMLHRKVIVTCDVLVELPRTVDESESFKSLEDSACKEALQKICSALGEGQYQGQALGCKFDVINPRMKVMFLNKIDGEQKS